MWSLIVLFALRRLGRVVWPGARVVLSTLARAAVSATFGWVATLGLSERSVSHTWHSVGSAKR
jgi:hypothetical protein